MNALILDWDGTAFNADRFKQEYTGVLEAFIRKERTFREGELARFVFPDALDLLHLCRREDIPRVLLSQGEPSFQEAKVRSAGLWCCFTHRIITTGSKGIALRASGETYFGGYLFIDDIAAHLTDVRERCPGIRCIRIDRTPGAKGDGESVITSLHQLFPFFQDLAA
jgi:hypothetical protein